MNPFSRLKELADIIKPAPTSPKEVPPARKKAYDAVKEKGKKEEKNGSK